MDDDNNLDILKMTLGNIKLVDDLVKIEQLVSWHYQVDVKEIKCPLSWSEKHETMFPTMGFFSYQILRIIGPK
jgi:hypothetical protein